MFSFPCPGCVDTGKLGYAYVFDSTSGESYIFLGDLAVGAQSTVQLVANIFTHEVVVQKVSKRKLALRGAHEITKLPEDREIRIVGYLNSLLHNPVQSVPVTPRWTTCISHEDIPEMSGGPRPKLVCTRVSYWKLCNGGSLADWVRGQLEDPLSTGSALPISIIARCIAQVSETLHFMYAAGREPVYHCDLHLANVFVHFNKDHGWVPDFYVGDFGWARTATEAFADTSALYGTITASPVPFFRHAAHQPLIPPEPTTPSPPPGTAPPGQRRRWDMARFGDAVASLTRLAIPARGGSEHAVALERLVAMLKFMDGQDAVLAARNARSAPPSLIEVIREAKKLERAALRAERGTDGYRAFLARGEERARQLVERSAPFVHDGVAKREAGDGLAAEARKARAESYGRANIEGPWGLIESI